MAVKKYSYKLKGNFFCSKNTQVREMASMGQGRLYSDTVLIDTKLMKMVDELFSKLQCQKYIISSGYRTPEHDRTVGGNGKGYHTKGMAVDACFYGENDKIIPAQIVCCVAQDLGFGGIANISKNYAYVHLDVRSGKKYRGDETVSTNTVTKSFYDYFGITREETAEYTGEKYYKRYTGSSLKVDTVFKAVSVPQKYRGSYKKRKPIADANGIKNYKGTLTQNLKLISLAKKGKLRQVI